MSVVECGGCGASLNIPGGPGQGVRCPRCGSLNALGIPGQPLPPAQAPGPIISQQTWAQPVPGQFAPYAGPHPGRLEYNPTGKATASLVLGIIGLLGAFCPLVGLPVTVVGLIMGIKGRKSTAHATALTGLILSAVGLGLTIINMAVGAYLVVTKQHSFLQGGGLP